MAGRPKRQGKGGRKPRSGSGSGSGPGSGPGSRSPGRGRAGSGRNRTARDGPGRSGAQGQGGAGGRNRSGSRSRRGARGLGGDQVEGRQAVRELLLAGKRRVDEVLMIDDLAEADVLVDIEELSQELGVGFRRVTRRHLGAEALTESHQGVVARAAPLTPVDLDDLMEDEQAFLLVLDGITDPGNLGAILRTAECAGVTGVVLGRHRSVHITPTVTKAAAGAVEHVPLALVPGIPNALSRLDEHGVISVGLDSGGSKGLFDLDEIMSGPVALVLGSEGAGLSRLARERASVLASIPLAGELNSLNVATATAIACFEVVRRRRR